MRVSVLHARVRTIYEIQSQVVLDDESQVVLLDETRLNILQTSSRYKLVESRPLLHPRQD